MKKTPILMRPAMVRALIAGRKTQTRRLIKPQPVWLAAGDGLPACWTWTAYKGKNPKHRLFGLHGEAFTDKEMRQIIVDNFECPYGKPGDLLWVRENHAFVGGGDPGILLCEADWRERAEKLRLENIPERVARWTPSIFMKEPHSRLTLQIKDVRVERLQEISKADAMAEGVAKINKHYLMDPAQVGTPWKPGEEPRDESFWGNDNAPGAFFTYFEKINGRAAWELNPWVWVIEFSVNHKNVGQIIF